MKLKYYLRGLGIGIIVTAIIMGVATKDRSVMTDEEIKARAVELGLVEQKVLADISSTFTPEPEETLVPKETEAPSVTPKPEETIAPKETEVPPVTPKPEETLVPKETEVPTVTSKPEKTPVSTEEPESTPQAENMKVTLVIKSGETSWSISKTLYEMGMVESATDFDSYLCKNGYDKTIRIGEFEIPKGSSYEEIAKIIAR